ncbi:MAG: glycosyltransferase [Bacteroidota bacterium]
MNKKYIIFFDGGGAVVKDTPLARQAFDIVNVKMPHAELMILKGIVHDELPYYYNAADAMLITSFHEGSNNSLKEARACNLPIVSVNVGDVSERLQNVSNTYVVDNRNAVDIADKLILVLQSNARSNGSAYSQDVSLDTIADKIINVYKSIKNKI